MAITNFIPTIWSETLAQSLDASYVGVAHCNRDYEGDIREMGAVVKICTVGNVTVGDYGKNQDMSAPQTLDDHMQELCINQAKYFNFQIDDIDRAQASPKLMSAAMREAAAALAKEADKYVYELWGDAGLQFTNEDTTVDNILDTIISARTALARMGVTDMSEVSLEVSPDIAELLIKAKLTTCTDNMELMETGCIGNVNGCRVFISPHIVAENHDEGWYYKCIMRTKRAISFAEQISEVEAYRPEKRFADAVKGLHLYGAKVVHPMEMVLLDLCIRNDA